MRRNPREYWFTTKDAARALGITNRGLRWLATMGRIKHERTWSGQYLFRYSALEQLQLTRQEQRLLEPTRRVRRPEGQLPLPLWMGVSHAPPRSWRLAKFKPVMLRADVARRYAARAKGALPDREAKGRRIA